VAASTRLSAAHASAASAQYRAAGLFPTLSNPVRSSDKR
jgi:hypothetical protein